MSANPHAETARFAEALVAMGQAADCLPRLESELADILPRLAGDERVRRFLADPTVRGGGKQAALAQILGNDVHPAWHSFLGFLAAADRLDRIAEIAEAFFEIASGLLEQVAGELVSAAPLSQEKVERIAAETGVLLGRKVRLRPRVDPALRAGLYVRVGDWEIDGTLDNRLNALRQTLLR